MNAQVNEKVTHLYQQKEIREVDDLTWNYPYISYPFSFSILMVVVCFQLF